MQVKQETEVGQTLWILLIKQTKKIKVGTLYNFHKRGAAFSSQTQYRSRICPDITITEKIIKGKEEDQQLIMIGGFNGKICGRIKGNMPTVTK